MTKDWCHFSLLLAGLPPISFQECKTTKLYWTRKYLGRRAWVLTGLLIQGSSQYKARLYCTSPPWGRAGAPARFRASASAIFYALSAVFLQCNRLKKDPFWWLAVITLAGTVQPKRTHTICLTELLRAQEEACAPREGQQHCGCTACTHFLALSTFCTLHSTALSLLPPLREITRPSRGGKSHHRKAGSVAGKNKLLMLLLLSE